jgi:integrase
LNPCVEVGLFEEEGEMSIYKRGDIYWYKFMWRGKLVRESTRQRNNKIARDMQSAHRTSLAKGEVGIRDKKTAPALKDFLKNDFLPFAETKHAAKPLTLRYYKQGAAMLTKSCIAGLELDTLTDQQAQDFVAHHSKLSPSGVNRGLRTLRRALNLAYQWGKIDKPIKVALAKGEHQRDRVLTDDEAIKYLKACPQPWRDCATIIIDEGFRPGEVFALRWPHILFNSNGTGLIQIVSGKSKAARRVLPMTHRVYALLHARHEAASRPEDDWVFPSRAKCGHFDGNAAKDQHTKALGDSGVQDFVPYVLRHTALTRLGEKAGGNVFALASIAGHSSITVTQRYIHPQADTINRIFALQLQVGTKLGTAKQLPASTQRRRKKS